MNGIEIVLERNSADEESALVAAVYVRSGTAVARDELVFEIEGSKRTKECYAPRAGILLHELTVGQVVTFGVAIALVVPAEPLHPAPFAAVETAVPVTVDSLVASVAWVPSPGAAHSASRFSQGAMQLLERHGIEPSRFDADYVTAEDVQAHVTCLQEIVAELALKGTRAVAAKAAMMAVAAEVEEPGIATALGSSVGQRAGFQALSREIGPALLSVLGVTLGPLPVRRETGDVFAGRITDLVIYEAARLMRKYPRLNAFYAEDRIVLHEAIHAGVAIDEGGQRLVCGLEHADKTDIRQLAHSIQDVVARYMTGELTAAELSRATFTVTDLSDGELDFVLPLPPCGQSCILGITFSAQGGFRIFAGFDHRVTDAHEVTAFLGDMRDRLLSCCSADRGLVAAMVCEYCERSLSDAVPACNDKGFLKVLGRDGRERLCCGSCWGG